MIFDSDSQKSYFTQRARDQLNLPTAGKESLSIKPLGLTSPANQLLWKTESKRGKYQQAVIKGDWNLCGVDNMFTDRRQEINTARNQCAHLQDIELADSNHGNEEFQIDLLIGSRFHVVI